MIFSRSQRFIWLAAFALVCAAGCGGSTEPAPEPDQDTKGDTSSAAEGVGVAGVPEATSPELDPFPRVRFETSAGEFTVKLHRERVPKTVANFLRYVDSNFYDGTVFHQVIPDYAVVGGGYTIDAGNLIEKTVLVGVENEAASAQSNLRGTIAMAREPQVADSGRSQFFINLVDNASLDYTPDEEGVPVWQTIGYCVFGEVEGNGLAILDEIARQQVTSSNGMDQVPVVPIVIKSVRRL